MKSMENKLTAVEWLEELYDNRPAYEEFILPEEYYDETYNK